MARNEPQINVRIPSDLRERLQESMLETGNSLTAEIAERLEKSFVMPSDIRILKAALQAAHQAMENQNRLINVLTVQPPDADLTPEYIEMHRRLVAEGAWEKIWAEMRELSKSLKEALDLVE